jgi:hypothetical protein
MANNRTRRYSIEVRDADGVILFSGRAEWTETERRRAVAQIERVASLPEANVYAEPTLQPQPRARRRPARGSERLPR